MRILFIVLALASCNQHPSSRTVFNQSAKEVELRKDTMGIKVVPVIDSNFTKLLEYLRREGFNLNEGRYPFESKPVLLDSLDSICVVEYKVSDIVAWYDMRIRQTEHNEERRAIAKTTKSFIAHLQKAKSVKGIVYSNNEMFVEQWTLDSKEEAQRVKHLFEGSKFLFPNTLSFAINDEDEFYVFHAKYNRPSWTSKLHYQWFAEKVIVD